MLAYVFDENRNYKIQAPNNKRFDALTALSNAEGQYSNPNI